MTLVMAGCGGGGSKAPAAGTSISGSVTFPVAADQVAKRVAAATPESVLVEVYGLDGKLVGTPLSIDSTTGQQTYSYSVPNLPVGADYVVKVKRGVQVLKKLVEKKDTLGTPVVQNVDAVTTAAVVVASQKLSTTSVKVVLGDPLPAGKTSADISADIVVLKPALIESSIQTVKNGGRSSLTADTANFANILNMVVVAVTTPAVGSVDDLLDGTSAPVSVPLFNVANPTAAPVFSNLSGNNSTTMVSQTVYVPPTTDAGTAAAYVQQAKGFLAKQDIANANKTFELALAADPENVDANMGGAITNGLMMFDDPDFKAVAARWEVVYPTVTQVVQGTSPIKLPFGNLTSVTVTLTGGHDSFSGAPATSVPATPTTAKQLLTTLKALQAKMPQQKAGFKSLAKEMGMVPTSAPSISEMQTVIDNVIIPRIDKILARLAKIEGKSGNSFVITKAMQGNPYADDVTLGDGDYYTLDSGLNILQVLLKIATSYNFDVPAGYSYDTIAQNPLAMINDPGAFVLKSGGNAKMAAALGCAKTAAAKAQLAFDVLKTRSAGVGAFDLTRLTPADKEDFQTALTSIVASLAGSSSVKINGKQVTIDLTKFFSNPLDRSKLPSFAYDVPRNVDLSATYGRPVAALHTQSYSNSPSGISSPGAPTYTRTIDSSIKPTSDLPDYTLNGILPGNSAANNVAGFNGILPMVSGQLLSGNWDGSEYNSTTDGTYLYCFSYYSNAIKKIDPATGVVSTLATPAPGSGSGFVNRLVWYQGALYTLTPNGQVNPQNYSYSYVLTLSPITIDGSYFTVGKPVWTSAASTQGVNISGVAVSGSDIYYGVSTWDQMTYRNSTSIRKLTGPAFSETTLFTLSDWGYSLSASSSALYVNGDKYDLAAPYARVASYGNAGDSILAGGYFYRIEDGKIVKFYGTPSKGTAKTLRSFF
jgi:hypothetical protein